jgi:hypothetical protein
VGREDNGTGETSWVKKGTSRSLIITIRCETCAFFSLFFFLPSKCTCSWNFSTIYIFSVVQLFTSAKC